MNSRFVAGKVTPKSEKKAIIVDSSGAKKIVENFEYNKEVPGFRVGDTKQEGEKFKIDELSKKEHSKSELASELDTKYSTGTFLKKSSSRKLPDIKNILCKTRSNKNQFKNRTKSRESSTDLHKKEKFHADKSSADIWLKPVTSWHTKDSICCSEENLKIHRSRSPAVVIRNINTSNTLNILGKDEKSITKHRGPSIRPGHIDGPQSSKQEKSKEKNRSAVFKKIQKLYQDGTLRQLLSLAICFVLLFFLIFSFVEIEKLSNLQNTIYKFVKSLITSHKVEKRQMTTKNLIYKKIRNIFYSK